MATGEPQNDGVVIIKKYANRRLYDTEISAYITLDRLAQMVRQKREFKVLDAKTGEDITRSVLTQIIMDEEARGTNMLPVSFLRQLISLYGDQMQAMVPGYLEASMDALQRNQAQFRDAVGAALSANPLAELARRNMEMFAGAGGAKQPERPVEADTRSEIEALKEQLAEMQQKLDRLGR